MKFLLIPLLLFTTGCTNEPDPLMQDNIQVGGKYRICGTENPFEQRAVADIVVLDKKQGWVQYCWAHDINNPKRKTYSRSIRIFNSMLEDCK